MLRSVITGSVVGEDLIYSGSSGDRVTVVAYRLSAAGGTGAGTWGSNGTDISGEIPVLSGSSFAEEAVDGLFETTAGENLTLTSGNASLTGHVIYFVKPS